MKRCPHCKIDFEFEKPKQFGAHVTNCKFNPKRQQKLDNLSLSLKGKKRKSKMCDKCTKEISTSNFDRHYVKCNPNKRQIIHIEDNWKIFDNKYKCPHCEKIFSKSGLGTHIFSQHTDEGINHKHRKFSDTKIKNKMGWSRGLTKETDIRIKKSSEKQHNSFLSGQIVSYWKGKNLSNEHRAKLSISQSIVLEEKSISNMYSNVKYYKQTNILGHKYNLRGTYELKMSNWLNKHNIIWIRNIYINYIKDEIKKTYAPDFYLPEYDLYLETKGYYPEKDQIKMKLVLEQNNIILKILFLNELEKLKNISTIKELLSL